MDQNILATQITYAGILVAFVNWLKTTSIFPSIVAGKTWLVRSISIVGSFLGALGIHVAWTPATDGTHTLAFTGLSLAGVALSAWIAVKQFVFTELTYRATKPTSNPQFVAAVAPEVAEKQNLLTPKEKENV